MIVEGCCSARRRSGTTSDWQHRTTYSIWRRSFMFFSQSDLVALRETLFPIIGAGAFSYMLGAMLGTRIIPRQDLSSPWLAMAALVPFAALVGSISATLLQLLFFMLTLGGEIKEAYLPLSSLIAALSSAFFGVWARGAHDLFFRMVCCLAVIAVGVFLVASYWPLLQTPQHCWDSGRCENPLQRGT
jgi:hypothetical protein